MSGAITFSAKIEKVSSEGEWHIIRVPDDVHVKLQSTSSKNGNVPVTVNIGSTTWPSTTMSMGQQRWFIGVKAKVRHAENITEGGTISVTMTPDPTRLK